MRTLTWSLVVIGVLALGATSANAVDITECGQVVPRNQVGNLVGDLDCSDYDGAAVWLEHRGTLNLNGFSLIGPEDLPRHSSDGVDCDGSCRVNGPGAITGFARGIAGGRKKVSVTDVDIVGASNRGIDTDRLLLTRCTVTGAGGRGGIHGGGRYKSKIKIIDSTISNNAGNGVAARKVVARDSVIVGNGFDCPPDAQPRGNCYDIKVSRKASLRNTIYGTCYGKCRSR